jgi:hypothetical protein
VPGRPGVTARLGRRRHHLAQGADGGSAAGPRALIWPGPPAPCHRGAVRGRPGSGGAGVHR